MSDYIIFGFVTLTRSTLFTHLLYLLAHGRMSHALAVEVKEAESLGLDPRNVNDDLRRFAEICGVWRALPGEESLTAEERRARNAEHREELMRGYQLNQLELANLIAQYRQEGGPIHVRSRLLLRQGNRSASVMVQVM